MLCEMCHRREAVISYAKFEEDSQVEIHLCGTCLEKKLKEDLYHIHQQEDGISGLIENMLQFVIESSEVEDLTCPNCQWTWANFIKTGKCGCEKCYTSFKNEINPFIESIQGSIKHRGKVSSSSDKVVIEERQLEDLRHELEKAIKKEEYEKAAILRDKIHEMLDLPVSKESENER